MFIIKRIPVPRVVMAMMPLKIENVLASPTSINPKGLKYPRENIKINSDVHWNRSRTAHGQCPRRKIPHPKATAAEIKSAAVLFLVFSYPSTL